MSSWKQARRLDRSEFAAALKKGLGRSARHVFDHGLVDVADLVLDACVHDQRYDPQAEPSRVDWLFSMFAYSDQYLQFRDTILDHLKAETQSWDALQMLRLMSEMAVRGDDLARQALGEQLRDRASRAYTSDHWSGAELWVELEGTKGLLELARIYGRRLLADANDLVPHQFIGDESQGQEYRETLRQHAKFEPEVKAYVEYLEAQVGRPKSYVEVQVFAKQARPIEKKKARRREEVRRQYDVGRIVAEARQHLGDYPSQYASFGYYATPDELAEIYLRLLDETDEGARLRLLWVFLRAPLPRLDEVVLSWANGADEALRKAAIQALRNSSDERVHKLAQAKVTAGDLSGADSAALDLFKHNYVPSDANLISRALMELRADAYTEHSLGLSLAILAEHQPSVELAPALLWVYEHTPCTNCRGRAVEQLEAREQLSVAMLHECLFDASEDTRSFARVRQVPDC